MARYRLADTITPPPGLRLSRANLNDLVLDLARQGPVTSSQPRERLSLDRVETLRLLTDLVESGQLTRVGERRGVHYSTCSLIDSTSTAIRCASLRWQDPHRVDWARVLCCRGLLRHLRRSLQSH